jgi:hypothetical protein
MIGHAHIPHVSGHEPLACLMFIVVVVLIFYECVH